MKDLGRGHTAVCEGGRGGELGRAVMKQLL